jgi:hypothetical protein
MTWFRIRWYPRRRSHGPPRPNRRSSAWCCRCLDRSHTARDRPGRQSGRRIHAAERAGIEMVERSRTGLSVIHFRPRACVPACRYDVEANVPVRPAKSNGCWGISPARSRPASNAPDALSLVLRELHCRRPRRAAAGPWRFRHAGSDGAARFAVLCPNWCSEMRDTPQTRHSGRPSGSLRPQASNARRTSARRANCKAQSPERSPRQTASPRHHAERRHVIATTRTCLMMRRFQGATSVATKAGCRGCFRVASATRRSIRMPQDLRFRC